MRNLLIIAVVAGVLGLTGLSYSSLNSGVPVETARVDHGVIREYIDEEGKTRLENTYLVTMPFDGRIESIDLAEGSRVRRGQLVARIVPADLELKLAAATAAVQRLEASIRENDDATVERTAITQSQRFIESTDRTVEAATARVKSGRAKLDYAERNLTRIQRLAATNSRTQDDLDQARVQHVQSSVDYQQDVLVQRAMESLRAATVLMPTLIQQYIDRKGLSHEVLAKQLSEAQVNLQQAERDRQRGEMKSPVDGVVIERAVISERQLAAGTLLLRIGRLEELEVEADVLSQEVVRVRPGNLVEIVGPTIGPNAARGRVARIYPAGFTKVSSLGVEQQRVRVIVKFDQSDLDRLRRQRDIGVDYRVRVRIHTAERSNVLVVPRAALFRSADGQWRVYAVRDGAAELRPVEIGLSNDERAEITRGLNAGDLVILAPETNLVEGDKVRPMGAR